MQYIAQYDDIMDELQVSIETVRTSMKNISDVYRDVVALESISRNDVELVQEYAQGVALEGLQSLPDIRTYTAFPSKTNLSVSTESIGKTISNAIAWIIKKVREFGRWIKQKAVAFYNWIRKQLGMEGPKEVPLDEVKDEPVPAVDAITGPVAQLEVEKETLVDKVEAAQEEVKKGAKNTGSTEAYVTLMASMMAELNEMVNELGDDVTQRMVDDQVKLYLNGLSKVVNTIPEDLRDQNQEDILVQTMTAAVHEFAGKCTEIISAREKKRSTAPDVVLAVAEGEDAAPVVKMSVVQESQSVLSAPRGKGTLSQETTQVLLDDADPVAARKVIAEGMVNMRQASTLLISNVGKAVALITSGKPEEALSLDLGDLDFGSARVAIDSKLKSVQRLQAKLDEMNNNPSQVASYLRNNILKDKLGETLSKEVQRHVDVETRNMDNATTALGKLNMANVDDAELELTKKAIDRITMVAINTVRQQLQALNHYNLLFAQYEISGKAIHAQYQALRKRNKK